MVGVSKQFQNNKQVLKDIYLSFFYGAKIGIIGLNGSGKSTLLKIIAGIEKSYQGQVVFSPGYSVGYLPQEPQLDPDKTVKEVVMEGVQQIYDTLKEYDEVNHKFELPEYYEDQDKMDALMARQAELQDMIDATHTYAGSYEIGDESFTDLSKGEPDYYVYNCSLKDNDQLIWFSDQYCNLEDPNETKRINRLVIKREKDSFVITCVNPFMKENGIKNETAFVMFSPAGNGLYSRNKESGLTLQDDVVMMWRKTLESNFIAEKKTF